MIPAALGTLSKKALLDGAQMKEFERIVADWLVAEAQATPLLMTLALILYVLFVGLTKWVIKLKDDCDVASKLVLKT